LEQLIVLRHWVKQKSFREIIQTISGCLLFSFALILGGCLNAKSRQDLAATRTSPSPVMASTSPLPMVSFLREGALWLAAADGSGTRQLVAAPQGSAINDHLWTRDGQKILYNVGVKYFATSIRPESQPKAEEAGTLALPETAIVDRLELARESNTIIAHTLIEDADLGSVEKVFATDYGQTEARELSVDEYFRMAPAASSMVRQFNELSTSPDGRLILLKEIWGTDEALFIADAETGARLKITDLAIIPDFENTGEISSGRRIIEAAWSPDGHFVVFNPAQSCSETLCYGRLFMVNVWSGVLYQLSREMAVNIPMEWSPDGRMLAYDDGGQIILADVSGQMRRLAEGNKPRFQPLPAAGNQTGE
jgi:Tol biopolymer transport system component